MLVALAVASCDAKNTQHNQDTVGPPVSVIASNLDGPDPQIPADGFIQLAVDRYLLPDTITRQSWAILDANHQPLTALLGLRTTYDPIARTVTLSGPDGPGKPWLTENLTYHLVLPVPPDENNDMSGFRAIDRAPLASPKDYTFRATKATGNTTIEPRVDFCSDVMPIFFDRCATGSGCHTGDQPIQSLALGSPRGVLTTALGNGARRVAQEANTAARAGAPEPPGSVFGINMALIEPGDPGSSWLLYKVELEPPPAQPPASSSDAGDSSATLCRPPKIPTGAAGVAVPPAGVILPAVPHRDVTDTERAVLNNYVLGRGMPYPPLGALTFQERQLIRAWIAQGAQVLDCAGCGASPDAGTPPLLDAGDAGEAGVSSDAADAGDAD